MFEAAIWKSRYFFYINLHLKDCLGMEFTFYSLLRRAVARGSADIIYCMSIFSESGIIIYVTKYLGHTQNISY